ncbi:30S ribosomal protein S4 [Meiothermus granaticius]|uniref:Small ribosomal subunit protein uS4 n=1 Tax=Meiothermus granaticius NBRC 107808 TaxID=1227551 RepID=A0A399F9M3_9DEIN|nr:30S ribosomal protein S4 [Meiothermus granaticius]MCL6527424.1 30S ribosomal protein S4 [Thermaceae bacterium]RIH92386.1 30S ribosomal protein S4 [Meiothermus granaticius NBRC 107808]GEM87421.1 30S ribosomal protein S4 [Meiothermus granaticius NBRC 107808]
MGRYRGPIVKIARRLGVNVAETEKVQKFLDRRPYAPGQHGQKRSRGRPSDYSVRLREKQKLRFIYDVSETQFRNLFAEASKRKGVTGTVFLQLLESRLDNVVFRLGIASTRRQARQFVRHGHILVNGKRVTIPGYRVRQGDEIKVAEKAKKIEFITQNVERFKNRKTFPWLEWNAGTMTGRFLRLPEREMLSLPVNEQLVIEFYSR